MRFCGIVLFGSLLIVGTAFGQVTPPAPPTPAKVPSQISGGVLNGKAVSLPKPAYPPAAKAVNAEGAVSVQVLIDENGQVISASAVSGHPLLRPAAVEAARAATFSPTLLSGVPVKVSGVIVYNFVGVTTTSAIGFDLAIAEKTGKFEHNLHPKSLAERLPQDWAEEKAVLQGLEAEAAPPQPPPPAPAAPRPPTESGKQAASTDRFTIKGTMVAPSYQFGKLTDASRDQVRGLQASILSKLAVDPRSEWHFRVGSALGNLVAELNDPGRTSVNTSEIELLAATAPGGVNQALIDGLTRLAGEARASDGSQEARDQLAAGAKSLKNLRVQ